MSKKIDRSIEKINAAMQALLEEREYESISITDIIKRAHISRSTFYAHFKTKDAVLKNVCTSIFDHVFSRELNKEKDHDFSKSDVFDYKETVTHIFYHFRDERELIKPILESSAGSEFKNLLSKEVNPLMEALMAQTLIKEKFIPRKVEIPALAAAFVSMVLWYVKEGADETPEEMTSYFLILFS